MSYGGSLEQAFSIRVRQRSQVVTSAQQRVSMTQKGGKVIRALDGGNEIFLSFA